MRSQIVNIMYDDFQWLHGIGAAVSKVSEKRRKK